MDWVKLIGCLGILSFFGCSHLGMLLYYKKYQYWKYMNCELQKPQADNMKSFWLYNIAYLSLALGIVPFWIFIIDYVNQFQWQIELCGLLASSFFVLVVVFRFQTHKIIHGISLLSAILCLLAAFAFLTAVQPKIFNFIYIVITVLFIIRTITINAIKNIEKYKRKTIDNVFQKVYILFLDVFLIYSIITL